jgi:hypothetical protein
VDASTPIPPCTSNELGAEALGVLFVVRLDEFGFGKETVRIMLGLKRFERWNACERTAGILTYSTPELVG